MKKLFLTITLLICFIQQIIKLIKYYDLMDNKRIITNLEALLDGYLTSTGECIKNNIMINDTEIVRTLTSVIEKLNNNFDESTTTQ